MMKKILTRCLCGLFFGIALGQLIAIVISVTKGDNMFHAINPELVSNFGGELNAVIIQTALMGLLGVILGATSVIWDMDKWSMIKQTVVHFCLFAISFTIVAYILNWIPRSIGGVLISLLIFIVIYTVIWFGTYFSYKRKVQQINDNLNKD